MKFIIFTFLLACSFNTFSAVTPQSVNKTVKEIEKHLLTYEVLNVYVDSQEIESVPPEIDYFYDHKNHELKLVKITVSKGVFLITYRYYFNDGKPLKYLVEYTDHPDSPDKLAIIYNNDSVIWKNVDSPLYEPEDIQSTFHHTLASIMQFR